MMDQTRTDEEVVMSRGEAANDRTRVFAEAAAVLAVLLPVIGACIRMVSFSIDPDVPSVSHLAVDAPISHQVATGLFALTPVLGLSIAIASVARFLPRRTELQRVAGELERLQAELLALDAELDQVDAANVAAVSDLLDRRNELRGRLAQIKTEGRRSLEGSRRGRFSVPPWVLKALIVILSIGLATYLLFANLWPWAQINFLGAVAAQAALYFTTRDAARLRFRHVVLPIGITVLTAIIAASTAPAALTLNTGEWSFEAMTGQPAMDGVYVELATVEGLVWLMACDDGNVLGVPTNVVTSVKSIPIDRLDTRPSLLDVLRDGAPTRQTIRSVWCPPT